MKKSKKKITTVSDDCIKLIEFYECSNHLEKYLTAYKCPAGVWTIGIGTTFYINGKKVKQGDKITKEEAYQNLKHELASIEMKVDSYTTDTINQHQFDALVCFAYNLGVNTLKGSGLLKKINKNPLDSSINKEFDKWVYADGKKLSGLIKRRKSEANLYFTGTFDVK